MRIAFFDSGIGGLTVLKQALAAMPNEEYLYYADTVNVPYGIKPKEDVRQYVFSAVDFLARQNIQALVVACNTATSVAISGLRERYSFPIIGMEPAVKPAVVNNTGKKILVLATSLTLKESKLEALISRLDKRNRIERRELDRLVTFAEDFDFDTPAVRSYLQERLACIRWEQYETVVLGCTHFIFYSDLIQALAGTDIELIDGNEGTVRHLVNTLGPSRPLKNTITARLGTASPPLAGSSAAFRSRLEGEPVVSRIFQRVPSRRTPAEPGVAPRITFFSSGAKDAAGRVRRLSSLLK